MKNLVLYFFFIVTTTFGQASNTKIRCADCKSAANSFHSKKIFLTVAIGESILFYPPLNGVLAVNFPYSFTNHSGTTQKAFNSTITNPFSQPFRTFELDVQVGAKSHFFDIDIGGGSNLDFYFSLGYGRDIGSQRLRTNGFRIKPSINIGFYEFVRSIGSVDNQGKEINAFGDKIDSTFYTSVGIRGQWKTYNSKYINVDYLQHDFMMTPKIAFEYHPFKNHFFIEVSLSYRFPFSEIAKIRLEQTDGGRAHRVADSFPLDTKDLTTTFNAQPLTNTPFYFGGLQVGIKIGI